MKANAALNTFGGSLWLGVDGSEASVLHGSDLKLVMILTWRQVWKGRFWKQRRGHVNSFHGTASE